MVRRTCGDHNREENQKQEGQRKANSKKEEETQGEVAEENARKENVISNRQVPTTFIAPLTGGIKWLFSHFYVAFGVINLSQPTLCCFLLLCSREFKTIFRVTKSANQPRFHADHKPQTESL